MNKVLMILFIITNFVVAEKLTVICWNVESSGAQPFEVAKRIAKLKSDIWGLSEVENKEAAAIFVESANKSGAGRFEAILGTTGGRDRLLIIYNIDRFTKLDSFELHHINITGRVRSPLVIKLLDKKTSTVFLFMVNHLYRSNSQSRHKQAQLLNQWTAEQNLPVIATGDYNFDWKVKNGEFNHDRGYDLITAQKTLTWVRPAKLAKTHDSHHNSVLDFIFSSYTYWKAHSEIIVESGDFPDNHLTSDHRPVMATFDIP